MDQKGVYNRPEDQASFDFLQIHIEGASEDQKIFGSKIETSMKLQIINL
jgi:hypothetical protein